MKKPVIGVTPMYDTEKDRLFMTRTIWESVEKAGGIPVIIPFDISKEEAEQLDGLFDGYVFTGGPDVNPSFYGEEKLDTCGTIVDCRDKVDTAVFDAAYKSKKPILGICRGYQLINVCLGGTLYQDVPTQLSDKVAHTEGPYPAMAMHNIDIVEGTLLHEIYGGKVGKVNSYHHQGIKDLAPSLKVMCHSEIDGLIEAYCSTERDFLVGVQWHPERLFEGDVWSGVLFDKLIAAAKEGSNK
ncbi:MAG: gamma-glutamyl-gamma-aminobutyrate hydrolase family protein [Ruminococcaceae bacterium]|nr:gamma-glutamyl-gamma-aminobutyrate hydrolase family protein [Oscillospiraceae bacterium]